MFRALLEALEAQPVRLDTSSLRFLFTAGAAIPVELIRAFEAHGIVLKQGYGQTETSILCCLDARDAIRKAGSVGRPVANVELRVVAPDTLALAPERWREVAPGESGEIVVRGPVAMLGYWRQPEASAEVLRGEWLRTGDLATVDAEGFVTLVGRARDMYISGGENVYPAEVEAVLLEHPGVAEAGVAALADAEYGQRPAAWFVARDAARAPGAAELEAFCRARLAAFKVPVAFTALAELPRNATGKLLRRALSSTPPRVVRTERRDAPPG
jgi:fatty-acyl-CoA synthase